MATKLPSPGPKILLVDIETAPHLVYTWGIWQQNVGLNQIVVPGYMLCWAAKWLGSEEILFGSKQNKKPLLMLGKIHKLLDDADIVIHYNGSKFDIPTLNKEFLENGFSPPSPYKQVDLLRTARSQFRFPSNKLDYLLKTLKIGEKVSTGGFELWLGCLKGEKASWQKMREYNEGDVLEMEKLYQKLLPWIKGHPNRAHYDVLKEQCPHCGSEEFQSRGYYRGQAYMYKKYQCNKCRKWFRGVRSEGGRQAVYTGIN